LPIFFWVTCLSSCSSSQKVYLNAITEKNDEEFVNDVSGPSVLRYIDELKSTEIIYRHIRHSFYIVVNQVYLAYRWTI